MCAEDSLKDTYQKIKHLFSKYDDDPLPIGSVNGSAGISRRCLGHVDPEVLCAAFAYALSRYTGNSVSAFTRVREGSSFPMVVDCSDTSADEFVNRVLITTAVCSDQTLDEARIINENLEGIRRIVISDGSVTAKDTDILLEYASSDNVCSISLLHSERFSERFSETFVDVLSNIISGMAVCSKMSEIDFTPDYDIELFESVFHEGPSKYADIMDAFKKNLETSPESIMLRMGDSEYTYSQAASIIGGLTSRLTALGISPGDFVAISVPCSVWYCFAPLAILASGGAYVSMDPDLPDDRIRDMMEICRPVAVLTIPEVKDRFESLTDVPVLNVSLTDVGKLNIVKSSPEDRAFIIFTSGTTGKPKAVVHRRKDITFSADSYIELVHMTRDSRPGTFGSINFIVHLALYSPIILGIPVDLIPPSVKKDVRKLADYIDAHGITHILLTPSVARLLLSVRKTNIQIINVGGEPISHFDESVRRMIVASYGCSEGIRVSGMDLDKRCCDSSVGFPPKNIKVYVLDKEGRRLPVEAVGSVNVSGPFVSTGYLGRDELNAKVFVPNPYSDNPEYGMMYNTGDLGFILPDGSLGLVGRADTQVKIRGNRVELTEVESAIYSDSRITAVTVQCVRLDNGSDALTAYVVPAKNSMITSQDVKDLVSKCKPAYMVPSFVMFLDAIPLSVGGKVNRRALPIPDASTNRSKYVAPRNETEKEICDAFSKILGIENIGIDDDFLDLGGDSLKAISLRTILTTSISTADILGLRTPRRIAGNIRGCNVDLGKYTLETGCPLTESQLNVYLDQMVNSKSTAYNNYISILLDDRSIEDAEKLIRTIVEAYPILKCRIDGSETPMLCCDSQPEILIGTDNGLRRPFDMESCLSRFALLPEGNGVRVEVVAHHVILDGTSRDILEKAISESTVPDEPDLGFLRASAYDQSLKVDGYIGDASSYFDKVFSDADTDVGLIRDSEGEFGVYTLKLGITKSNMETFVRRNNLSNGVFTTSVFAYALSRYTGRSEAVFCTVDNGRDHGDIDNSIGMFVRTFPLRIDCSNREIKQFLKSASSTIIDTMRYGSYPFRLLSKEYGLNAEVIFQYAAGVIDSFNDFDDNEMQRSDKSGLNCDISAVLSGKGDVLTLSILHTDKYSVDNISRLCSVFDRILTSMVSGSSHMLSDIAYTSDDDISIEDGFNDNACGTRFKDVLEAFRVSVNEHPKRPYVSFREKTISYEEADKITDAVASQIVESGITRGSNIASFVSRSEWYGLAFIAVIKAGCVYVPIDETYPDERIGFMIADSSAKAVLVTPSNYQRASNLGFENILDVTVASGTFEPPEVYEDSMILYTSGTTGKPKGALITNMAVTNFAEWYTRYTSSTPIDKFAMYASYGFDAHMIPICGALFSGGCIDIVPEEIRLDLTLFNEHIIECGITELFLPTSVGKIFVRTQKNRTLRHLMIGGEPCGDIDADYQYTLIDGYGPTENFIFTSVSDVKNRYPSSVGGPLINNRIYILDDEGRRVPFGAVGELFISGHQLARCYVNRPDINAVAFTPNGFCDEMGYRTMYSTGDYARYLPDGTIQILGRRDGQVKIRGNRVELTEVESAILSINGVTKVTVQPIINNNGGKELCAYVVSSSDMVDATAIKSYVAENKPSYMVPTYVVMMDDIPLNVNGKVDKRKLPTPEIDVEEYVAPRNTSEKIICDAFSKMLGIPEVGIDSDFSALGGDSIKAINVVSYCHSAGLGIAAQDIIGKRTPRMIATVAKTSEYNCEEVTGSFPLPPTIRMFDENIVRKDRFDQTMVLICPERMDKDILQRSLDAVIRHHDMLRVRFGNVMTIPPSGETVCRVTLESIEESEFDEAVATIRRRADIYNGRMVCCGILRMEDHDELVLSINHLSVDAVSWRIILDDLLGCYIAYSDGKKYKMPSKTMSYPEWVSNVLDYANLESNEYRYWKAVCSSIPDPIKGSGVRSFSIKTDIDISCLETNPYCARVDELLMTAYAMAYCKVTSDSGFRVAMEGHGRSSILGDVSRTVGWFTCIYPVSIERIEQDIDDGIYSVMKALRNVPDNGIGYGPYVYAEGSGINRNLPSASFNYLSDTMSYSNGGYHTSNHMVKFDEEFCNLIVHGISLNVLSIGGKLSITCFYDIGTVFDTYANEIVAEFVRKVKEIIEHSSGKIASRSISCGLSLAALNVLLDESKSDMGNAYNSPNFLRMPVGTTVESARTAVEKVIDAHPSLKIRVTYRNKGPWFVCDSEPEIRIIEDEPNLDDFNRRFDFHKGVSRFWINENTDGITVMFNVHHLAIDNYSVGNLRKDIIAAHEGKNIPLDLGFVIAANQNLYSKDSVEYLKSVDFFTKMFADMDTDSAPIADSHTAGPCEAIRKMSVSMERVDGFVRSLGVSASSMFTSAFAYSLSRFTGRTDSIFCFMENGRNTGELEGAVGMFAKILPIRIDCTDDNIDNFISNTSSLMIDAISNDIYPFYEAAKMLNVNGSVQFQFVPSQNFMESYESISDREHVLTDFDFNILINGDEYVMCLICSPKYSKETAERFLDVYECIINGFLSKNRLSEIEYISECDRRLIDGFNKTSHPLVNKTILEAFSKSVRENPDKIFVKYMNHKISYAEGNRITDSIASDIKDLGIGKGHMVAIFVSRSESYAIAPLAVIKTGAAYVPIDTSYPDERAIHMIVDSGSVLILSNDETYKRAKALDVSVPVLNISELEISNRKVDTDPDAMDPCVVLYTSGTTGKPKGSLITHRAVVNMCEWYVGYTGMTSDDSYGFYTSIAFDIHTMALFAPMVCSATVDIVPEEVRLDMVALNKHYVDNNITHTFITTQVGKLFASSGFDTAIRFLLFGGEKLGVFSAPESIGACESYGPSENLSLSTAIYVNDRKDPSSVGHLLPNIKAYVLDKEMRMVPIGAVGELHLAGYQLSLGYFNREDLNSKVFKHNPYSNEPGYERIYATGDFFRWLPDGTLGIIGRRDGQLKIRGNRVEITEIDDVIRKYPGIKDVTIQPIVNDTGGKELCAYIVSDGTNDPLVAEDIKRFVSDRKPAYMAPAYVVQLDAIPLTVNAKVDRKSLPMPDSSSLRARYSAPRNRMEEILSKAFSSVLNIDMIGIDDDFIQLGGDSIKAIRLIPLLHSDELEELRITPADIIAFRTIREIMSKTIGSFKVPELFHYSSGCPLTDSQRSFYEYAVKNPDFCYNLPLSISKDEWTDVNAVHRKIMAVMLLCPVTSSRIILRDGEPYMVFDVEPEIPIVHDDPKNVEKEFVKHFDLIGQPLCRFLLCEWNGKITLFQDYHHIVFDGMSIVAMIGTICDVIENKSRHIDDGILLTSAYDSVMKGTERYEISRKLAESAIIGSCSGYLQDDPSEQSKSIIRKLSADGNRICDYVAKNKTSITAFLSTVLGCTFNRISGRDRCLFFLTEDGRGHLDLKNSVCLYAKGIPVSVETNGKNRETILSEVSDHVFKNTSYDEYAVWEMMRDYGVEWNIRLQYAGYYKIGKEVIGNDVVNLRDVNSEITDLWVMVREEEKGFAVIMIRSKKFSDRQMEEIFCTMDEMVNEFLDGTDTSIIRE